MGEVIGDRMKRRKRRQRVFLGMIRSSFRVMKVKN